MDFISNDEISWFMSNFNTYKNIQRSLVSATNYFRLHLLEYHIDELPNEHQFMNSMKLVIPFHEKTHEIKCDGITSFMEFMNGVSYQE